MEYNIGNKKQQQEYNIEEEITPSQISLRYVLFPSEENNIFLKKWCI